MMSTVSTVSTMSTRVSRHRYQASTNQLLNHYNVYNIYSLYSLYKDFQGLLMSLGILRNVTLELDAKPPCLRPTTTQLQTRQGTFKVCDVSATSSKEPVSMSDLVVFMGSGGWPLLCA